jgi:hypothetical protein
MANSHTPTYTNADIKERLLAAGASGTVYSLVMPESEAAMSAVIDGLSKRSDAIADSIKWDFLNDGRGSLGRDFRQVAANVDNVLHDARSDDYFSMYHEPWTNKQDAMHKEYFETWLKWAAPIVNIDGEDFKYRYPTAGASEGIVKIMAELQSRSESKKIHVFEGEYEGFKAYAESLNLEVEVHDRANWRNCLSKIAEGEQFWISQPSAIDGKVWDDFEDFVDSVNRVQPSAHVIPDLTYVGCVAKEFNVNVNSANIPAVIISHSKPMGGYYQRVGGVLAREEFKTLFGNVWFKNLQSLAWATQMMKRHDVYELPRKYRAHQEEACYRTGKLLGIEGLEPADISVLAIAAPKTDMPDWQNSLMRGSKSEQVVRICLTPAMTTLIDPKMAPTTAPKLYEAWHKAGLVTSPIPHDPTNSAFRLKSRGARP